MIFVTSGAGYIGSHTCVELLDAGYDVTVFDNFSNSHPEAVARIERITGKKLGWCEATSACFFWVAPRLPGMGRTSRGPCSMKISHTTSLRQPI